jgi:hypothetical protein
MRSVPTITITDADGGFLIINQSDFDPAVHTVFAGEVEASPVVEAAADAPPAALDEYDEVTTITPDNPVVGGVIEMLHNPQAIEAALADTIDDAAALPAVSAIDAALQRRKARK